MNTVLSIDPVLMKAAFGALLSALLIALAVIDLNKMILPDRLNLLLAAGGVAHSLAVGQPHPIDAGAGCIAGGAALALVAMLFRKARGIDGLGLGDQKFVAAAGIWIGWQEVPYMLFMASTSALAFTVVRAAKEGRFDVAAPLPFGPFLGLGTLLAWISMTLSR